GADHDDRNISLIWIALDDFENLVPVQIRHHQIEEDETELFLLDQRNCLVSASRAGDPLVAIGFEHQLQRVAIILIVIDDEVPGRSVAVSISSSSRSAAAMGADGYGRRRL